VNQRDGSNSNIQKLLDERLKVLQWLDRLNDARSGTPADVFESVRHDYQSRLDGVARKLEGFTGELQEALSKHQTAKAELTGTERAAENRLAEAKLRHMVGEFGDDQWDGMRSKITAELDKVRQELSSADSEITRLEEVLQLIDTKPNTAIRKAIPMVEPPPPMPVAPKQRMAAPAPRISEPTPTPAPRAPNGQSARPRQSDSFDELAFLKSVTEDEQQGPAASKATGQAVVNEPIPPARVSKEIPIVSATRADTSAGPKKTLKCGECGVMNFPTEWYCERCGAELAAL
jgi:ElaB/YqjD/DUF883 family membrane-anchored ribosome-binding protein